MDASYLNQGKGSAADLTPTEPRRNFLVSFLKVCFRSDQPEPPCLHRCNQRGLPAAASVCDRSKISSSVNDEIVKIA